MESILMSVSPKDCELIVDGKKELLVQKTCPTIKSPFRCYIYETKNTKGVHGLGKVVGEFVCDSIEYVNAECSNSGIDLFYEDCKKYGCLSEKEVEEYFGVYDDEGRTDLRNMKGNGYAWHISDLKIYDKPKELRKFEKPCRSTDHCRACTCSKIEKADDGFEYKCYKNFHLTHAPRPWLYVEEK